MIESLPPDFSTLTEYLTTINIVGPASQAGSWLKALFANHDIGRLSATAATSFVLITAAEIGDKSQLVCMTLAARHKATPVLAGSVTAFMFLNSLAVIFGAAISGWLPDYGISAIVCLLFGLFGFNALRCGNEEESDGQDMVEKSGHGVFWTAFALITVAEFGDKTQLAVATLSTTAPPAAVWTGATMALAFTSALGIIAGRRVLTKIPVAMLHKFSGGLFLILAGVAGYQCFSELSASGFSISPETH